MSDLLPEGFSYIGGSWAANSNYRGNIKNAPTIQPVYNNDAVWLLGSMIPGEVVTLTYQAQISTSQQDGTYRDIAWAAGDGTPAVIINAAHHNTLYATGVNSSYISGAFVGTEVTVDQQNRQPAATQVNIRTITSQLPRTGIHMESVYLAVVGLLIGVITLLGGIILESKQLKQVLLRSRLHQKLYLLIVPIAFFSLGAPSNSVRAQSLNNLDIRISTPASPITTIPTNLTISTFDLLGRPITVKCYASAPGSAAFTQFDSLTVTASGDSENCEFSGYTGEGSYEFYATATTGGENDTSPNVSAIIDATKPSKPINYSKSKTGTCSYQLNFKIPNDGQSTQIEIYRSESTSFTADGATFVDRFNVSQGEVIGYNNTKSGCSGEVYYAVRTVDTNGNRSDFTADQIVNVTVIPPTTPPPVDVSPDSDNNQDDGQVAGTSTEVDDEQSATTGINDEDGGSDIATNESGDTAEGEVLGDEDTNNNSSSNLLLIVLGIMGVSAVGGTWYYLRLKNEV